MLHASMKQKCYVFVAYSLSCLSTVTYTEKGGERRIESICQACSRTGMTGEGDDRVSPMSTCHNMVKIV
eukprot:5312464-Ditylum_brightwellii.AAC.1